MNIEINKKLSIVIPTYNRASFLDYSLETHIPLAKEYNISIYIFDNASSDNTNEVVKKWMKQYQLLYYSVNEENLGSDVNFVRALNRPCTDYVWPLGDTSKIEKEVLKSVVKQSKQSFDLILLNDQGRVLDIPTQILLDKNALFSNLGWQMSQMSSVIFRKRVIKKSNFTRFYDTNFIHVGIIFEYLSYQESVSVNWNQDLSIEVLTKEGIMKTSWHNITFDLWIKKWANFILSLPVVYSLDSKLKVIQEHNEKAGLFGLKNLLLLRSQGYYSIGHYISYRKYFGISLKHTPTVMFLCVALLPVKPLSFIIALYRKGSQ
jgi:abequosyltransferase